MGKFFFKQEEREGQNVTFTGAVAHHMLNVLRFRVGQELVLCDGARTDFCARLESINMNPPRVAFALLSSIPSNTEPAIHVTLYQGLPKGDKMEWIIEKSIEAGASRIIPVSTVRSVVKTSTVCKKKERLNRIAESAAAQSMRGIVPVVSEPQSFVEALAGCNANDLLLAAYEKERNHTIKSALTSLSPKPVSLWVGPEGGFDDCEIHALIKKRAQPISLGPRVLRTETAGIVALAQIFCIWDEYT